jgi:type I restriction enzyme S subunit
MSERQQAASWQEGRAVDLFYIKGRLGWKGLKAEEFLEDGPYLITGTDFVSGRVDWDRSVRISDRRFEESPEIAVRPNDILVTKDGTIGKIAFIDAVPDPGKASLNSHLLLVRRRTDAINQRFAFYVLESEAFRKFVYAKQTGSTLTGLPQRLFEQFVFPLPPVDQQQAITDVITSIDRAIEQTEALIAKTQQIKTGLMRDLFTRGVLPNGQLRPAYHDAPSLYKASHLGLIPAEWDIAPCAEWFDVQLGKMMSPAALKGSELLPYMRNQNVLWNRLDLSDVATMNFTTREVDKFRLKAGDLLACEGRFIGRCAIWRDELDECYYQKALHRLRARGGRVSVEFMQLFMSMRFEHDRAFVERMTHESTIPHLSLEKLNRLPVLGPSVPEQERIVAAAQCVASAAEREEKGLAKVTALKTGLIRDLLTGSVRVRIGQEEMAVAVV